MDGSFGFQREAAKRADPDAAAALLAAAETKRSGTDQMMWQVPALSVTAQAFLLTIALGASTRWLGRGLAAGIGIVAVAATIQLLLKHRRNEEELSHWLEQFARDRGWPVLHSPPLAEAYAWQGRGHRWRHYRVRGQITEWRSVYVWVWALVVFGLVDFGVIALWVLDWVRGSSPLS